MADFSPHNHDAHAGHASHGISRVLTGLAIGGAVTGAAIILAPHVLPLVGIGTTAVAQDAFFALHTYEASTATLAGFLNHGLAAVPLIGGKLAEGGLFNAAATAITGIGGVLLGNFICKKEGGTKRFSLGKAIKYAALFTSAMIALPTVLTGLGAGLIYLARVSAEAGLLATATAKSVIGWVGGTLGTIGYTEGSTLGLSGLAATLPHLITCGLSLLPAGLAFALAGRKEKTGADVPSSYPGSPVIAEVELDRPTALGKSCAAKIKLKHADSGLPLSEDELAVVHTEKLHLFVVDDGLKDYRHIHPQPTGEPGVFACSFTPETSNRYSAWMEVTPLKDTKTYQLKCALPSATSRHIPPVIRANDNVEHKGINFHWSSSDALRMKTPAIVAVHVTDNNGRPVTDLEPIMGARAHLVGFSADGKSLVHTHPLDGGGTSPLRFHIEPDKADAMQFYLQVRRHGEDIYVPFGQHIRPQAQMAEKTSSPGYAAALGA